MSYSYMIDIASALFILILIIYHTFSIHIEKKSDKVFMLILYSMVAFDITNAMTTMAADIYLGNYLVAYIFKWIACFFFSLIASLFAIYSYTSIRQTCRISKLHLIVPFIPIIWNIAVLFYNQKTNACFVINEEGVVYYKKYFLLFLEYIAIMIYMPVVSLINRKKLYKSVVRMSFTFALISLAYGILQYIINEASGKYIFMSTIYFSLLVTDGYLYMQKDRMNLDIGTNLYMRNQCLEDLRHRNNTSVFLLEIIKFHHFSSLTGDKILRELVSFLESKLEDCTMYRIAPNQLVLKIKCKDDFELLSMLDKKFKEPVVVEGDIYYIDVNIAVMPNKYIFRPEYTIYLLETMINKIKDTEKSYIIFNSSFEEKFAIEEKSKQDILNAINVNSDVIPYFQGIYSVDEERIVWSEALARLRVNDKILLPSTFMPVFEEHECINKLDDLMFHNVLEELKNYNNSTDKQKISGVSINFTADDINDCDFVNKVKKTITDAGIPPQMIYIEICEGMIISNFDKVKDMMNELNDFGVRFFLDDFGTGFSNFQAMLNLPFHLVKLDKSLLDSAKISKKNYNILYSLVKMINSVGIKSLIEGAETEEDIRLVKSTGVNYIQGYYYHQPSMLSNLNDKINQ